MFRMVSHQESSLRDHIRPSLCFFKDIIVHYVVEHFFPLKKDAHLPFTVLLINQTALVGAREVEREMKIQSSMMHPNVLRLYHCVTWYRMNFMNREYTQ